MGKGLFLVSFSGLCYVETFSSRFLVSLYIAYLSSADFVALPNFVLPNHSNYLSLYIVGLICAA